MGKHYINSDNNIDEVVFKDEDGDEFTIARGNNGVFLITAGMRDTIYFCRKDIPNLIKLLEEADRLL